MTSIMGSKRIFLVLSTFTILFCVNAFNIDVENFIPHRGQPGSMFGFSVAQHRERGQSWLLIGAPEAQTQQPGILKGGAVFICYAGSSDRCREIAFDTTGDIGPSSSRPDQQKSNQWFGATVYSSGEDGVVVACAPRYVWYSLHNSRRDPVGTCFTAKNVASYPSIKEYSPCRTRNWGYHRQGYCQAGLGASVSRDGNTLFIGAPGSWYWQGEVFSVDTNREIPWSLSRLQQPYDDNNPGQLFSQNLNNRTEVITTGEGSAAEDNSYLGYSVAVGKLIINGEEGVAVGMPRGSELAGKVSIYTWNLKIQQNITGDQIGAYFGYSICTVDVDGDKLDDIVIGSPLYTDYNNTNDYYETGRIHVYYQSPKRGKRFVEYDVRYGQNSKSRFGLAVSSVGDLNDDGFGDFAVGAPYDGPEERGAVYIYLGSKKGVHEKYSQVIFGNAISRSITTFGYSLSGGMDLDENQYPDLVVGAYEADTAVFLRARPVVKVQTNFTFNTFPKDIILEEKNCTLRNGDQVSCLPLTACISYKGKGTESPLDFKLRLLLDSKKPAGYGRMFFLDRESANELNINRKLYKSTLSCFTYKVYIKQDIRDKLSPVEAELQYSLDQQSRRVTRSLQPILDETGDLVAKDSVSIKKNCGPDNKCIPDLKLTANTSVSEYIVGSGELVLEILVENFGEGAYEAMTYVYLPTGINYRNTTFIYPVDKKTVFCVLEKTNQTVLKCDIGNPIPTNDFVRFKIFLSPFYRAGMKPRYDIRVVANTSNPEDEITMLDNEVLIRLPLKEDTKLKIEGFSYPSEVYYNTSQYADDAILDETEIGPQIFHVYSIKNDGPSDIEEAEIILYWPSETLAGDRLLYLIQPPITQGEMQCEEVKEVNELGIKAELQSFASIQESQKGDADFENGTSFSSSSTSSSSGSSSSGSTTVHHHTVTRNRTRITTTSTSSSSSTGSGTRGSHGGRTPLTEEEQRQMRRDEEEIAQSVGGHRVGNGRSGTHRGNGRGGQTSSFSQEESTNIESQGRQSRPSVNSETRQDSYSRAGTSYRGEGERETGRVQGVGVVGGRGGGEERYHSSSNYSSWKSENGGPPVYHSNYSYTDSSGGHSVLVSGNMSHTDNTQDVFNRIGGGSQSNIDYRYRQSQDTYRTEQPEYNQYGSRSGSWSRSGSSEWQRSGTSTGDVQGQFDWDESNNDNIGGTYHITSHNADEMLRRQGSLNENSGYESNRQGYSSYDDRTDGQRQGSEQSRQYGHTSDNDGVIRYYDSFSEHGREGDSSMYNRENTVYDRDYANQQRSGDNDRPSQSLHQSSSSSRRYFSSHSSSKDGDLNVIGESDKYQRQFKREVRNPDNENISNDELFDCTAAKCTKIRCTAGPLEKDSAVRLEVRSRIWARTTTKIAYNAELKVSSYLRAKITSTSVIGTPEKIEVRSNEVITDIHPIDRPVRTDIVPLWIVVLSAVAGVVILLLLIFVLYKLGFFKRKRPSNAPERQPLNRNGHYQAGDEAL